MGINGVKYVWRKRKHHSEKAHLYDEAQVNNEEITSIMALCNSGWHLRMWLREDLSATKCPACEAIQKVQVRKCRK